MYQIPSDETVESCLITAEAVRGEAEPVLTYSKTDEQEEVLDPFIEKKDDGEIA
jgi:ATP-dependent protease Clp ATPase subunit